MWVVERVESRARQLDFTSAGMGPHSTTGVYADGMEIVNALDLVDFSPEEVEAVQLIVCEGCGHPGCNSGGRVSFRRLDDGLLMIPSFGHLARGEWELTEYGPPHFIDKRGVPLFTSDALKTLRARLPVLEPSNWPVLSAREAALVMQWEAPSRVLGQLPDPPKLERDMIVAVTHGAGLALVTALENLLGNALGSERPTSTVPGEVVTFYLDNTGYREWSPLALTGDTVRLAIAPGLGISFG